ncbi:MAG: UDP-N-acetylmuramoyl-tripeptide--D-alanyl-D-alanine ligase [Rickettsiales bacterium]|jgi:UDP-N-acetylmuramoyl-tripeptide--D-alanyl-D-alanine ligase|nr:UDP-N-acetylmuramoyl-tripeptide--D-alanyl-D-alanine ligase [Rickettsiales bacterium]
MKFFQQNNYYNYRFARFAVKKLQLFDKRVFFPLLIVAFISNYFPQLEIWILLLPIAAMATQIVREKNPTKDGIKPLAATARVKRIFGVAFILWCAAILAPVAIWGHANSGTMLFYFSGLVMFAPVFPMIANTILIPVDKLINQKYINEAKAKLKKYDPIVIGITGSFGKTSLKNILQHILGTYSSSITTKRSINTLMGIVRVIREEMNQPYKYFIAEMGMAQSGQIAELARFLRPKYGIIAAVAAAHLENFRNIDGIAREKFALSKHVAKDGGLTLLSATNIAPEFIEKYKAPNDIVFTGQEIENVRQTAGGLSFTLDHEGNKYEIFAPIYGIHQAQNIALAFIMARMLGVSAENIAIALKTLKQTEHRLELRKEGDLTILDDSFNSNIKGFISALETGAAIKGDGRFILITPGMVELGKMHTAQHRQAGELADKLCDIVIAVNPERMRDFTNQISVRKLVKFESLKEARGWLAANARADDIVLYENDLPDVYIEKIKI